MPHVQNPTRPDDHGPNVDLCMMLSPPLSPPALASRARATGRRRPYLTAVDKNATSAWIWDGLSVLLNVSGMIPEL